MNIVDLMEDKDLMKEVDECNESKDDSTLIHSDDEADEVLGRIIWARKKLDNAEKVYKKKEVMLKEQLDNYKHRLMDGLKSYEEYQSATLQDYLARKFNNKKGSVKLLHGNARLSEHPESVVIDDEEALMKYIAEHKLKACVKVKAVPQKTLIKKALQKDNSGHYFVNGEDIVPGVHIEKEPGFKLGITPAKVDTTEIEDVF